MLAASPLLTIFVVVALGTALGAVPLGPLRLGPAGALFVGLAVGAADPRLGEGLALVQTLGLALFVYTVGVAAGSTFARDLRTQAPLIGVGAGVLVLAAATAVGAGRLLGLDADLLAGTYAGALTSTPALAAASAAAGTEAPAVGYSLAYPVGVVLAILVVGAVVGRTWPGRRDPAPAAGLAAVTVELHDAVEFADLPAFSQEIRLSYLEREGRTRVVTPGERLEPGDRVVVVGPAPAVERAVARLGTRLDTHLADDRTEVDFRRFVVSNRAVAGRTVAELDVPGRFGGVVTRVRRGDLDLLARDDLSLELGDRVLAVVPRAELDAAARYFGDSERKVSELDALTVGIGMALGLAVGLVAVPLPGGAAVALGSAAGPLLVGMLLGAVERTGPVVWGMPYAANLTARQLGLLLFLATVGLASGPAFAERALTGEGLVVIGAAVAITAATCAALLAGARLVGVSAPRAAGALAGLLGQPAILAHATARASDERVESGYAALFAVGIVVKILLVQVIVAV